MKLGVARGELSRRRRHERSSPPLSPFPLTAVNSPMTRAYAAVCAPFFREAPPFLRGAPPAVARRTAEPTPPSLSYRFGVRTRRPGRKTLRAAAHSSSTRLEGLERTSPSGVGAGRAASSLWKKIRPEWGTVVPSVGPPPSSSPRSSRMASRLLKPRTFLHLAAPHWHSHRSPAKLTKA